MKTNSLKSWILAARPKTLTAAAVPVMIATSLAWKDAPGHDISWTAAIICTLFAFIMQIDANFINDYFDFMKGNDDETRLGPKRACAEGWITAKAMRVAIVLTTAIACLTGLPLIYFGGWEMIIIGAICVVLCFLYTTTLSYIALGDALVLVCFGIIPVCCTYYLEMPSQALPPYHVMLISIACGLVIDTLLIVNNYRDIENDKRAGKKTLAVILGKQATLALFLIVVIAAMLIHLCVMPDSISIAIAVIILSIHFRNFKEMKTIGEGKELNKVLGSTSRLILIYGLLSSISVILI